MLDHQFLHNAKEGLVILINQLKSIHNSPFRDSHSYPNHTCFSMFARNGEHNGYQW